MTRLPLTIHTSCARRAVNSSNGSRLVKSSNGSRLAESLPDGPHTSPDL